jgi:cytochrome c oxidase accessory protein FixG
VDKILTNGESGALEEVYTHVEGPLYADRVKVYPQRIAGLFRRFKWVALGLLLTIYYVTPWLRWDRGPGAPDQAVLVDMPGRRIYFFWIEIWPQEIYYLAAVLILAAIALFLVTSLFGRVWCGFSCPQTVWTDLFMWVERAIEGDRNKRIKLDQSPLSGSKVARKAMKHGAWLLIAFATGGAWIMYFNDAPTVVRNIFTGQASSTVYGFTALFTATTYVLAGWAREQVCIYMCPWPRFQAAMFDEHTMLVTYEAWRGEPRGKAKAGSSPEGRGHCIDCGLCVRVCPTGIDIRRGQQLDCIGCGLCIDACNSVMEKMSWPKELITYDSLSNQACRTRGEPESLHLLRPRTFIYVAILLAGLTAMLVSLMLRSGLEVTVQPDRAPLFVQLSNGGIQNGYTVKIINKTRQNRSFLLSLEGLRGAVVSVVGHESDGDLPKLSVRGDSVGSFRVFVRTAAGAATESSVPVSFIVSEVNNGEINSYRTYFHGPQR